MKCSACPPSVVRVMSFAGNQARVARAIMQPMNAARSKTESGFLLSCRAFRLSRKLNRVKRSYHGQSYRRSVRHCHAGCQVWSWMPARTAAASRCYMPSPQDVATRYLAVIVYRSDTTIPCVAKDFWTCRNVRSIRFRS